MNQLASLRQAIIDHHTMGIPGPILGSAHMLELIDRVIILEQRVAELSELANGANPRYHENPR